MDYLLSVVDSLIIAVRYCTVNFLFLLFHLCIVGPMSMYIYI